MTRWARLVAIVAMMMAFAPGQAGAQDEPASIRIIHGISDLGPVDLYLDGALAVVGASFPSVTDPLMVDGGDRRVTVTPSGLGMDQALVDSVVTLLPGTTDEIAVVGSAANVSAVLFPMDRSELDEDRARIRVVHASPDTGPLDPVIAGGDQLFPTVQYQQSTDYAEVPFGEFPVALLYSGSMSVAVDLPLLALEPGSVTDLYVIGQVADGTVQPLVVQDRAEVVPLLGRAASLREGSCVGSGAVVQDLGLVVEPRGRVVGAASGEPVNGTFASIPVPFDAIVGAVHSIEIAESEEPEAGVTACAEIGGPLTDVGSLAVPLRAPDGDLRGVAVIAPGVVDPEVTDISLLLVPPPPAPEPAPEPEPAVEPAEPAEQATAISPGPITSDAGQTPAAATPAP
jgi:hypothetical protein